VSTIVTEQMEHDLRVRIRTASNLPSPPAVAARLIKVADDPDLNMTTVVDILRVDPALTAKLLRLANSPLYARRRHIDTLQQAVTLLGLDAVMTAALSLTLLSDHTAGSRASVFQKQWSRSVHAAVAAQALAVHLPVVPPPDAFLAALLQDIGVLVIAKLEPSVYEALDQPSHEPLIDAEVCTLGFDHATAGAELLSAWNLPGHVVNAVRHSHRGDLGLDAPLDAIVAISGLIADGVAGDVEIMPVVRERADVLGITVDQLNQTLAAMDEALPQLAPLLHAAVPPTERLAEMAAEMIMERLMSAQAATDELRTQFQCASETATLLVEQNRIDPLTRQLNRHALEVTIDDQVEQWNRFGWPFAILFVDVDHFKQVNDTWGHSAGDDVLGAVAAQLSQTLRHGDLVGRFGGDEFIVVLPAVSSLQASNVAARLVASMRSNPIRVSDGTLHTQTVSIGVAATDQFRGPLNRQELIEAADRALYAAKHDGRDAWAVAPRA
jgi:diguanylate cyclase (GGDEF)-like protein